MIIVTVMIIIAVLTIIIKQPFKNRKRDYKVQFIEKSDIKNSFIITIGFCIITFLYMYSIALFWSSFGEILLTYSENKDFMKGIKETIIPVAALNGLVPILLIVYTVLVVLGSYLSYKSIVNFIAIFKKIKARRIMLSSNTDIKDLLLGLKSKDNTCTKNAYKNINVEKKEFKLYITQWEQVVKSLLLTNNLKDAYRLGKYLEERKKYTKKDKIVKLFDNKETKKEEETFRAKQKKKSKKIKK